MDEVQIVSAATNDVSEADLFIENLFRTPQLISENEAHTAQHRRLVSQLLRDSAGLPLDTAQFMLIERNATLYSQLQWYTEFGGVTSAQLEKLNDQYLRFATQFQKVLLASDEALRQDLIKKVGKIVSSAVDTVQDDKTRQSLRLFFGEQFAAMGW